MKIAISGFKELGKDLQRFTKDISAELRDEVNKAAVNVDRNAKKNTPVDTGRLRSSIHAVPTGTTDPDTGEQMGKDEAAVVTNVEYAWHVEFGTGKMNARPFLFPAWEKERPEHIKRVKKILGSSRLKKKFR